MSTPYFEAIQLIERLHRYFLDVVKVELDRKGIQDINNVQAMILYNIGHDEMTVGELTLRGYYLGSNVSYNVKKMGDIKEGQQVRTSFTVEKDSNVAKSISLDTSMGGSGLEPDKGINQDTGGSGLDQGVDKDMGGSGDVGGDVGGSSDQGGIH